MKHIKIILASSVLLLGACKSLKMPQEPVFKEVPAAYSTNAVDSNNNTAKINYKDFFDDEELLKLIDTALKNNPDLQIAYQNIQIAKAGLSYQKAAMLPNLSGLATFNMRKFGYYTMDGAGNATTDITPGRLIPVHLPDYMLGLQSSWEIDIWGKLKSRKKAALARFMSSVEGKNLIQTSLIADIATYYYELSALDSEIEIIEQNIKLQEKSLELVRIQKEAGRSTELAVKQFEAQILNSKAAMLSLSQSLFETENTINLLLGRYPQQIIRRKLFQDSLLKEINAGVPVQLLKNRPDIRAAELELAACRADVLTAKKSFYPSLNLNITAGLQSFSPGLMFGLPSITYNALSGIAAPLLNRAVLKQEFNTASAVQISALYNYQKTLLNAFSEVYNELKKLENLNNIFALKSEEVKALENAIAASEILFSANRADYLEVLNAQQNGFQSKIDLLQCRKLQKQSLVSLFRALGGGWQN
jgi:NodT family efflux transporter outer membrane factor (OMF) lipoprotein